MNESADPFRDWDAAYVLGALSGDDRRTFERHFASCPVCAAAVAELAGIPGILTRIDAEAAVALASAPDDEHLRVSRHEPDLIQRLARSASRGRRRKRQLLGAGFAAAAALLIVIGVLAGTTIHQTTDSAIPATGAKSGTVVAMSQVQPNALTADLRVTSKPWGTRFDWSCNYGSTWAPGYPPKAYDLVITDITGVETKIATWRAVGPSALGLAASSSVRMADIRTVEIRAAGTVTPLAHGNL